jgi:hypothetical protein
MDDLILIYSAGKGTWKNVSFPVIFTLAIMLKVWMADCVTGILAAYRPLQEA